ncbi:unnamed protein product [Effrenium voratum]|nr:unnamed protein product [Effrenium voratum]
MVEAAKTHCCLGAIPLPLETASVQGKVCSLARRSRSWRWMNASALPLLTRADVVLEKGTLDALKENPGLFQAAVREAYRVLTSEGLLISVTDSDLELEKLARLC